MTQQAINQVREDAIREITYITKQLINAILAGEQDRVPLYHYKRRIKELEELIKSTAPTNPA